MTLVEFEKRARRNTAHRMKLIVQMLTTTGYASTGSALADPIFNGATFGGGSLVGLAFGLVCLGSAIYLVPEGERYVSA